MCSMLLENNNIGRVVVEVLMESETFWLFARFSPQEDAPKFMSHAQTTAIK